MFRRAGKIIRAGFRPISNTKVRRTHPEITYHPVAEENTKNVNSKSLSIVNSNEDEKCPECPDLPIMDVQPIPKCVDCPELPVQKVPRCKDEFTRVGETSQVNLSKKMKKKKNRRPESRKPCDDGGNGDESNSNPCSHHKDLIPPTSVLKYLKFFEVKSTCTSFHLTSEGFGRK